MDFRIADTFTDSLARLTGDELEAVKTTAFDLQMQEQAVAVHHRRVAVHDIEIRTTLKQLHHGGNSIAVELCIVGVEPTDDVAFTLSECFVQCLRLTPVGFAAPRDAFGGVAEDTQASRLLNRHLSRCVPCEDRSGRRRSADNR